MRNCTCEVNKAEDYSSMQTSQNKGLEAEILYRKTRAEVELWSATKRFSFPNVHTNREEITHRPITFFSPTMKRRVFMDATLEKCCMTGLVECGEQLDKFEMASIAFVEGQRTEDVEEHDSYVCPVCLRNFEYNEVEVVDPFSHNYTRYNKQAAIDDLTWVFGDDENGNPREVEADTDPRIHVKYNTIIEGALMTDDPNDDVQVHRTPCEEGTRMNVKAWKALKDLPFWCRTGNGVKHIYNNRRLFEAEGMDVAGLMDVARMMSKGKKDKSRKSHGWGMIRYAISKAKGIADNAEMDKLYSEWIQKKVDYLDGQQGMERIKTAKAKEKGIIHAYSEWYPAAPKPEVFVRIEDSKKNIGHKMLIVEGSLIENNQRKTFKLIKGDWVSNTLVYSDMDHMLVLKTVREMIKKNDQLMTVVRSFK
jgi:hypothetical protein